MEILPSLRYQTTRNMKSFSFDFFVPKRVLFSNPQKISCTRRECIRLLYSLLRLSDRNDESIASHHALSQAHSLEIIFAATFSPIQSLQQHIRNCIRSLLSIFQESLAISSNQPSGINPSKTGNIISFSYSSSVRGIVGLSGNADGEER